jgi:pyrimidine-nucleoside phosphorylase
MPPIMDDLQTLSSGGDLTAERAVQFTESGATTTQLCALAYRLAAKPIRHLHEADLLSQVMRRLPVAGSYIEILYPGVLGSTRHTYDLEPSIVELLLQSRRDARLGRSRIDRFVSGFIEGSISPEIVAIWLTKVCYDGLCNEDVHDLTLAMRDSGKVYDYRNLDDLDCRRIIRRYPTGALSEKAALILPSLLSACRLDYPLASPFLVGRSLGFTGGTWDKLSSVPGFTFPDPGEASIRAMQRCGVAMSVTQHEVNPADRILYQLRSITGTVASDELIVSSVASKQLSYPADLLLLDMRHGDGAFLPTLADARRVGSRIIEILESEGVPSFSYHTDTPQPNGIAIGNAVEVLEALAVMGCSDLPVWNEQAIGEQTDLVVRFFAALMQREFPLADQIKWRKQGHDMLRDGTALGAFRDILRAHGVTEQTVSRLTTNPSAVLVRDAPQSIVSPRSGMLRRINQRRLGEIINFQLGAGGNEYAGSLDLHAGVVLRVRLGDFVSEGGELCLLYAGVDKHPLEHSDLAACFELSEPNDP